MPAFRSPRSEMPEADILTSLAPTPADHVATGTSACGSRRRRRHVADRIRFAVWVVCACLAASTPAAAQMSGIPELPSGIDPGAIPGLDRMLRDRVNQGTGAQQLGSPLEVSRDEQEIPLEAIP